MAPGHVATPAEAFTALLIDDHAYVRESMVGRLRRMGAGEITEASSLDEARVRAHVGGPRDLCLLDFALLARDGHLLVDLRTAGWGRVLLLSAPEDPFALRAAFLDGVRGYLLAAPVAARAPGSVEEQVHGPPEGLSSREIEVLRLVADGLSNDSAGRRLKISALTVKSHLARIARKLGTGDRAGMVLIALRAGVMS